MSQTSPSPAPHEVSVLDLDRLVDGWHHDPHSILGPHLHGPVVTIRVLRPAAESVTAVTPAGRVPARARAPRRVGDRHPRRCRPRLLRRCRVRRQRRAGRRPLPLPAHAGRDRPAPDRRGPARAALAGPRCARAHLRDDSRRRQWRVVRRLGAECPGRPGGRRLQLLGRNGPPHALPRGHRASGSCSSRTSATVPSTSSTSSAATACGARRQIRSPSPPRSRRRRARSSTPPTTSGTTRHGCASASRPTSTSGRCRSTRCTWGRGGPGLDYRDLAAELTEYVRDTGFTHVEFLPVAEHPYGPSWGYQVTSYFAPTSRFGKPDDLRYLIDSLHEAGIGVLVDWVPAHFPKDAWALARFDGTPLYEHADPRRGRAARLGHLRLRLRAHRGPQLPGRQCPLLARGVPRRRPAGRRRRVDALPGLLAQGRRVVPQRVTAGARTSRRWPSCRR